MPFQNNNKTFDIVESSDFQVGRSNSDDSTVIEQDIGLPWASDPAGSYVYYECLVGQMLDSGMVVHNRLPQVDKGIDTLAVTSLDANNLDSITTEGVNLTCKDQYQDIMQRMGHARYWFRLWGQALRIGYRIPIPSIKYIGGVPAVPYDRNPQWALNAIVPGGNYGGVILWRAQWSLWYTTLVPPVNNTIPAADPSAHISGDTQPPTLMQAAFSQVDSNAEPNNPVKQR